MIQVWQYDDQLYLCRNDEDLWNVWWAGCLMHDDWQPNINDVVADVALDKFTELSQTKPTHKLVDHGMVDVGGYGEPFGLHLVDIELL